MKKFAAKLTNAQYAEARQFEAAGLTTISQAVKAFERNETSRIAAWRQALAGEPADAQDAPAALTADDVRAVVAFIGARHFQTEQGLASLEEAVRRKVREEWDVYQPHSFEDTLAARMRKVLRGKELSGHYWMTESSRFDVTLGPAQADAEHAERHAVSEIIWWPAGYRATSEMAQLTYLVRRGERDPEAAA